MAASPGTWMGLVALCAVLGTACSDVTEGMPSVGNSSDGGSSSSTDVSAGPEGTTRADTSADASTTMASTTDPPQTDGSTGDPSDDPGDPFDPVPPFEPMDPDALEDLQRAIDAILDEAGGGPTQGVLIVDLENDEVIYEKNADAARVPASNTKLVTTASSMDILGADHRMVTEIRSTAAPDGAGVVAGDVYLMGDHDFTWSTRFYPSAREPLDQIAEKLVDLGVTQIAGAVVARGDFCYEGQSLGVYNPTTHRSLAVARFRDALTSAGITVSGGSRTESDLDPPARTQVLTQWWSPPLSSAFLPTNVPSHNEFADIALRHLGWRVAGSSNYIAGGDEMRTWMGAMPTDVTAVAWLDGSGLAHGNMASARNLVDLFMFMTMQPHGEAWLRTMAVSGIRGTLGSRMAGPDTFGRFWGKTGTLPSIGVVTLSGLLYHRHDHRRYAVSILLNTVPVVDTARSIQNRVVEELARDHRLLGAPPSAPTLAAAVGDDDSTVIELSWSAVDSVDGYVVWLSPDGFTWALDEARLVPDPQFRAGALPYSPTYVRITAMHNVPEGPLHSPASDVYAATAGAQPANILLVDGNDRWQAQPVAENPRGRAHDFIAVHAAALPGIDFDSADNDAVAAGDVDLASYDAVVWALGEESEVHESFAQGEQADVTDYLQAGGSLFVSGAELGFDLAGVGSAADRAFLEDVLGVRYVSDDAQTTVAGGGAGLLAEFEHLGFLTLNEQEVEFPDQLAAAPGASAALAYRGGLGGTAAVTRDDGATVVLGFPFESIDTAEDRTAVMQRVLGFFGL